jgi:hypothetical protein
VDPVHHAGSVQERGHLIEQLLDIKRDLGRLRDVAGIGTSFGRLGDTGRSAGARASRASASLMSLRAWQRP